MIDQVIFNQHERPRSLALALELALLMLGASLCFGK